MTPEIRLGLIGAGRMGRLHAEHLVYRIPEADLVAISDLERGVAQEVAARIGVSTVYQDNRRLLDDSSIDAVVICASTDAHTELIRQVAAVGKPVFCEKPVGLELDDIDRTLAAVEEAEIKLQIGFNRRFDHNFRRVREAVTSGEIGEPHTLRIVSRDPEPPPLEYIPSSGGMLMDMTIHDIDMARYLVDGEIDEVYAAAGVMVDPAIGEAGDIDTVVIILRFANGAICSIDNSRQAVYGYDQRLEVFGSEGSVRVSNDYPNTAVISDARRIHRDRPLNSFVHRYVESYVDELRAFVACVLEDQAPPVTGMDGRLAVVVAQAARRSYVENRPVKLSEMEA